MDRGAWWAAVHEVARSRTQLSDFRQEEELGAPQLQILLSIALEPGELGTILQSPTASLSCW